MSLFKRAPIATVCPSEERDTLKPDQLVAASPSKSSPSCSQIKLSPIGHPFKILGKELGTNEGIDEGKRLGIADATEVGSRLGITDATEVGSRLGTVLGNAFVTPPPHAQHA